MGKTDVPFVLVKQPVRRKDRLSLREEEKGGIIHSKYSQVCRETPHSIPREFLFQETRILFHPEDPFLPSLHSGKGKANLSSGK